MASAPDRIYRTRRTVSALEYDCARQLPDRQLDTVEALGRWERSRLGQGEMPRPDASAAAAESDFTPLKSETHAFAQRVMTRLLEGGSLNTQLVQRMERLDREFKILNIPGKRSLQALRRDPLVPPPNGKQGLLKLPDELKTMIVRHLGKLGDVMSVASSCRGLRAVVLPHARVLAQSFVPWSRRDVVAAIEYSRLLSTTADFPMEPKYTTLHAAMDDDDGHWNTYPLGATSERSRWLHSVLGRLSSWGAAHQEWDGAFDDLAVATRKLDEPVQGSLVRAMLHAISDIAGNRAATAFDKTFEIVQRLSNPRAQAELVPFLWTTAYHELGLRHGRPRVSACEELAKHLFQTLSTEFAGTAADKLDMRLELAWCLMMLLRALPAAELPSGCATTMEIVESLPGRWRAPFIVGLSLVMKRFDDANVDHREAKVRLARSCIAAGDELEPGHRDREVEAAMNMFKAALPPPTEEP